MKRKIDKTFISRLKAEGFYHSSRNACLIGGKQMVVYFSLHE